MHGHIEAAYWEEQRRTIDAELDDCLRALTRFDQDYGKPTDAIKFAAELLRDLDHVWEAAIPLIESSSNMLCFQLGCPWNGERVETAETALFMGLNWQKYGSGECLVDQNSASWNRVAEWLTRIGTLRSLCTAE